MMIDSTTTIASGLVRKKSLKAASAGVAIGLSTDGKYSMLPQSAQTFLHVFLRSVAFLRRHDLLDFFLQHVNHELIDRLVSAASEHCFTFSSSSPSSFILCEPNIHPPLRAFDPMLSRKLRAKMGRSSGTRVIMPSSPALKRWAKLVRPTGLFVSRTLFIQHSSARAKDRRPIISLDLRFRTPPKLWG